MHANALEKKIHKTVVTIITAVLVLYIGQGIVVRLRLAQLQSELVGLKLLNEECDPQNCRSSWQLVPQHRFLLLGHILRTHQLIREDSGESLLPVSAMRGTAADSWASLRVYAVEKDAIYILRAEKPKAAMLGYFTGVYPRTTDHEGVLTIPDVSPTMSTLSGIMGLCLLGVLLAAALVGQTGQARSNLASRRLLNSIIVAAGLASVSAFVSTGALNSLMPEGEGRNKILRFSLLLSQIVPVLVQIPWFYQGRSKLKLIAGTGLSLFVMNLGWEWIRAGVGWALIFSVFSGVLGVSLARNRFWFAAFLVALSWVDTARILGFIFVPDYPPIYLLNATMTAAFCLVIAKIGGVQAIAMAGIAYRRFLRDMVLAQIQSALANTDQRDSTACAAGVREILPDVAQLLGAGRVSIVISLPLGRPITQVYEVRTAKTTTHDDGKITGAATVRAMVYGDEALFESFDDFAVRLKLPTAPHLVDAHFFCVVPIRVNNSILGTIMLTRFDDEHITKAKKSNDLDYDCETIRFVVDRLAASFSNIMVQDLHSQSARSLELQKKIHQIIGQSNGAVMFLELYAAAVREVSGMRVMIHQRVGDRGVALVQSGFKTTEWKPFVEAPFNLAPDAAPAFGGSVVAFREDKSSYVKDVQEIFDKLQVKSRALLTDMHAKTLVAVPMRTTESQFVITAISATGSPAVDPGIVGMLESTEAIFVAALEVMNQKTSVMALGQLASRLIGDDEVRSKILDAAKSQTLPTTIGSARTSYLLLIDLAGSSSVPHDTYTKAAAYGKFYDAVNQMAQDRLGGSVRKTIGDALIVTWDGTDVDLNLHTNLLQTLDDLTSFAGEVAREFGCTGVRALLHHGSYFFGLVGTSTFGQIDVIGSGIDDVCKLETTMKNMSVGGLPVKLALTKAACEQLHHLELKSFVSQGFVSCDSPEVVGDASQKLRYLKTWTPLPMQMRLSRGA